MPDPSKNKNNWGELGLFAVFFTAIFGSLYGIYKIFQGVASNDGATKIFAEIASGGLRSGFTEDQVIESVYAGVERFKKLSDSDKDDIKNIIHLEAEKFEKENHDIDSIDKLSSERNGRNIFLSPEKFVDYATEVLYAYEKKRNGAARKLADMVRTMFENGATENEIVQALYDDASNDFKRPLTNSEKEIIRWSVRLGKENK